MGIVPIALVTSPSGTVVLVHSAMRQRLMKMARISGRKDFLYLVPDAAREEMLPFGFDYRFHEQHPMHFIGLLSPCMPAPPAEFVEDEQEDAIEESEEEQEEEEELVEEPAVKHMCTQSTQTSLPHPGEEQAKRLKQQVQTLTAKLKKSKKSVYEAQRRAEQCEKACEEMSTRLKAIELANKKKTTQSTGVQASVEVSVPSPPPQKKKKSPLEKRLARFRNATTMPQLDSFLNDFNPFLCTLLRSYLKENKSLQSTCDRVMRDHERQVEKLKKEVNKCRTEVKVLEKNTECKEICNELMVSTGAKDIAQLKEMLGKLYSVAGEFLKWGSRKPLHALICYLQSLLDIVGRGMSHSSKCLKLFALLQELKKFGEDGNLVEAMNVFNMAMQKRGCPNLSTAALMLSDPHMVLEVGKHDQTLADVVVPEEWTVDSRDKALHFVLHSPIWIGGKKTNLMESQLALQEYQPPSLAQAAAKVNLMLTKVSREMRERGKTCNHQELHAAVWKMCKASWQKRPMIMKIADKDRAQVAARALHVRDVFHLGGVLVRNIEAVGPLIRKIFREFPNFDKGDYKALESIEGEYLAQRHMETLTAASKPLFGCKFGWCNVNLYVYLESTQMLWDIVLNGELCDAVCILVQAFGCTCVDDQQIYSFRRIANSYQIMSERHNPSKMGQMIMESEKRVLIVDGPCFEESIARQLDCPYGKMATSAMYWHWIYHYIAITKCNMVMDWHVATQFTSVEDAVCPSEVPTPPQAPKIAFDPESKFVEIMEKGLKDLQQRGLMSDEDVEELRKTKEKVRNTMRTVAFNV